MKRPCFPPDAKAGCSPEWAGILSQDNADCWTRSAGLTARPRGRQGRLGPRPPGWKAAGRWGGQTSALHSTLKSPVEGSRQSSYKKIWFKLLKGWGRGAGWGWAFCFWVQYSLCKNNNNKKTIRPFNREIRYWFPVFESVFGTVRQKYYRIETFVPAQIYCRPF